MKKADQMRLAVQQWKESGLTQKAFCEKIGVKRTTFANWVGRNKDNEGTGFIAIPPREFPDLGDIEISYPSGARIKVSSFQAELLSQLIRL